MVFQFAPNREWLATYVGGFVVIGAFLIMLVVNTNRYITADTHARALTAQIEALRSELKQSRDEVEYVKSREDAMTRDHERILNMLHGKR